MTEGVKSPFRAEREDQRAAFGRVIFLIPKLHSPHPRPGKTTPS